MTTKEFEKLVDAFVQEYRNISFEIALGLRNDGGPGSGNFGHKGREGEIGGSAPSDGHLKAVHEKYGKTVAERKDFRKQQFKAFREKVKEHKNILKMRKQILDDKLYYVRLCDQAQRKYEAEGEVEKRDELLESRKSFDRDYEIAKKEYEEARLLQGEEIGLP